MDPFDEFEFKPITEGLGFHGKEGKKPAPPKENSDTMAMQAEPTATLNSPLPREANPLPPATPQQTSSTETVDEILKTLQKKKKFEFKRPDSFINEETRKKVYIPTTFDFSAALLDSMLIVAAYLLSLIMMLMITKVDLFSNLLSPDEHGLVYVAMIAHFTALTWIYLVANRIFLGCTPGEWVFDQILGNPDYVGKSDYSLRVALRSFLVVVTGFITFPIISLITGRDVVGQISGVQLFKRP